MLDQFCLSQAEKWLNQLLLSDPATPARLSALSRRQLVIEASAFFDQQLHLNFTQQGIHLTLLPRKKEIHKDAEIIIGLAAWPALVLQQPLNELIAQRLIEVRGDADVLERVRTLFGKVVIDWPAPLTEFFGEPFAQLLVYLFKEFKHYAAHKSQQITSNFADFITQEQPLIIDQLQFSKAKQQLQQLETQLKKLQHRLSAFERNYALIAGEALL